jgi:Protein of unknown function (DUF4238)/SEC-C motif
MTRPGRNDPCHCGSEKKYKKCCLDRDREVARGDRPSETIDGSDSPRVKDGHIVPRIYQRPWEDGIREVAVHRKGTTGCEARSTKLVGTRGPFYRRTRPEGEEIDDIEKSLSVIEGKAATPLRELIAGRPLEPERKGIVAQFLAAQLVRGPAFFEQREELIRPTFEGAEAKDFVPGRLASMGGSLQAAREKAVGEELDATKKFTTMLAYARKVASILGLMRWQILRFEGPLLAYSDHPVVLWPLLIPSSAPFPRQIQGPLETLEVRVALAPDVAILMNWLDRDDEVDVEMPPSAAAELNAFTVSQAEAEWMHKIGSEPPIGTGFFKPLSRLIDPSYGEQTVSQSARHALADRFVKEVRGRKFVNEVEVLVEMDGPQGEATSG